MGITEFIIYYLSIIFKRDKKIRLLTAVVEGNYYLLKYCTELVLVRFLSISILDMTVSISSYLWANIVLFPLHLAIITSYFEDQGDQCIKYDAVLQIILCC